MTLASFQRRGSNMRRTQYTDFSMGVLIYSALRSERRCTIQELSRAMESRAFICDAAGRDRLVPRLHFLLCGAYAVSASVEATGFLLCTDLKLRNRFDEQ